MQVKIRQAVERAIVARLVKDAIKQGFTVSVLSENDRTMFISNSKDAAAVLAQCFQMDEDRIFIQKNLKRVAWFYLVYGNDGFDVISDYSANDTAEAIIKGAEELARNMESGNVYMSTFDPAEVVQLLADNYALARLKFGNLDPDANKVFERTEKLLNAIN